ncbi:phage holin [Pseudoneobacillus sp. C159]
MINWKVRFKNRTWMLAFVSQVLILAEISLALLNTFGIINFNLAEEIKQEVLAIVNTVFVLMSMLGVVQDPTTKGIGDSERAKGYTEPK